MHEIRLSGKTHELAVVGSSVPEEERWPKPRAVKRGRGWTYVYEVDDHYADLIHLQLVSLWELYDGGGGDGFADDARWIAKDLTRNWPEGRV